jgi:hypothetical protein
VTINNTPIWLRFTIIIGFCLIVFALIKGCQHFKAKLAQNDTYKGLLDSMIIKSNNDSITLLRIKQENADTISMRDAELSLVNNKLEAKDDSLDAADKRIDKLLKRYIPIDISKDTSITTVSNDYIENCADCFGELQNDRELVKRARAEKDNQSTILNSKINGQSLTITKLEKLNGQLQSNLNNLINASKDNVKKLEQRRVLYFSLATIAIEQYAPSGIGGGFMYMDKRMRLFGGNAFVTNRGAVYQIQLSMPLSFKR